MIAVCNASPIIALSLVDRFHVLTDLFPELLIPPGVSAEVVREPSRSNLENAIGQGQIRVHQVGNAVAVSLLGQTIGRGESEAIVLAQELSADFLLPDEERAGKAAVRVGLTPIGTVGLLMLWCKDRQEPLRPLLDALLDTGFRISDRLLQSILGQGT